MKKENTAIQELLNQIYNEPDLGEEVFEFIYPHIINAYHLIETDDYNKQLNQARIFTNEKDIENLRHIVYRDFPSIFNMYTALPLKYRTTNKLKTGKTHRETLLKNMNTLVNNIINIENLQYESMDTDAIVKTKMFDARFSEYESPNVEQVIHGAKKELETQSQVEFSNEFSYDDFKKTVSPEDTMLKENHQFKQNKNIHIDFKKGIIEEKISLKEKMKIWMGRTAQAIHTVSQNKRVQHSVTLLLSFLTYPYRKVKGILRFIYVNDLTFPTIMLSGLAGLLIGFIFMIVGNLSNPLPGKISDIANYAGAKNQKEKELNMVLLESYVKKNPTWTLTYKNEGVKEVAVINISTKASECRNTVDRLYSFNNTKEKINVYRVNKANLSLEKYLGRDVPDLVCDLPDGQNNIHLEMDLMKKE